MEGILDPILIDKLYAGWISKCIGVRLGAPVEGWTYAAIKEAYGIIDGYIMDYKNFAADDDTNVPIFLIRAMENCNTVYDLTCREVAEELLNASPFEHGFFWWGGYGISSEHTAYLNLMNGIEAPRSGSWQQNGSVVAEQIGGQIFIDVWGLICPGRPDDAAYLAKEAASVTHDGNAVYGGVFIACCISIAYEENDIRRIIEKALAYIPHDCTYAKVVRAVMEYHNRQPHDWEACYQYILENYGYDKYPGNRHIIPNAAVMILALLYGDGDYDATLNIGVMCGWDTDCNVGNIATIMGVRGGTAAINYEKWRAPIRDLMICSGTMGSLNIQDNAQITDSLLRQMEKVTGLAAPEPLHSMIHSGRNRNHFEYSGSIQAMRERVRGDGFCILTNTEEEAFGGKRSLKIRLEAKEAAGCEIYKKTYYFPKDFDDSRYDPSFSPTTYPGQTVHAAIKIMAGDMEDVALFVRDSRQGMKLESEGWHPNKGEWNELCWKIPADKGLRLIDEVGLSIRKGNGEKRCDIYLDDFYWEGEADYCIDFADENLEDWRIGRNSAPHFEISQFTRWKGITFLENGCLHVTGTDVAAAYTGDEAWKDYEVEARITPLIGKEHYLQFRVQGAMRSYAFGLCGQEVVLMKNRNGFRTLCKKAFLWEKEQTYLFKVTVKGNRIRAFIDGQPILEYEEENAYLNGSIGLMTKGNSHLKCRFMRVKGMD